MPVPTDIKIDRAARVVVITWDDGRIDRLAAELLRVESPSAEVQGHGPNTKVLVTGKRHVTVIGAEPIGHYALRLMFDDGHDSGLFTWAYFRELADRQDELFARYLATLGERGLSRDDVRRNDGRRNDGRQT